MVKVFALIITETGKEEYVLKKLKELGEVEDAYIVYGKYDIIAKVVVDNMRKIPVVISKKIRKIECINSTDVLVASGN